MVTLRSRDNYTIGWMTALSIETAAAIAILDEKHELPADLEQPSSDSNVYTCGRIGNHDIVISCLPSGAYGTTSALATVIPMLTTFPNIKFGLLVGIGAGIPNKICDIRLGDVVISLPSRTLGGVFQYDLGKARIDAPNGWERTGILARPPDVLLKAVTRMQADHELRANSISTTMAHAFLQNPKMSRRYNYPGADLDMLFAASYTHAGNGDCGHCDADMQIQRWDRGSTDPEIHYGIIGSGNTLVKDAKVRDWITAMEPGCICLEMEAAGLMNSFPCIVIRGICDYADSHKNDAWQRYASMTAAACAKELLGCVPQVDIDGTKRAIDLTELNVTIHSIEKHLEKANQITIDTKIGIFLSTLNDAGGPYVERKNRNPQRVIGTCEWFTSHELFNHWRQDPCANLLWVSADPGCGKSVLSKYLIDEVLGNTAEASDSQSQLSICYFFFKDDFSDQRTATGAISSILFQLFQKQPDLVTDSVLQDFAAHGTGFVQSFSTLWATLLSTTSKCDTFPVICIIDALDECEYTSRKELIHAINQYALNINSESPSKLKFLVTSRPYQDIGFGLHEAEQRIPTIHLKGDGDAESAQISKEINLVIQDHINRISSKIHLSIETRTSLYNHLTRVQHRTYLWVYLALEELERSSSLISGNIDQALSEIGTSTDSVYEKILSRSQDHIQAKTILQIIIAAYRPQTVREVFIALHLKDENASSQHILTTLPALEKMWEMIRAVCGLFVRRVDSRVYLIHQTAKEFLVPTLQGRQPGHFEKTGSETSTTDLRASNSWKHSLRSSTAHFIMAKVCLRFLQFDDECPDDKDFQLYCKHYFYAHLYQGDQSYTTSVSEEALKLLDTRLLGWWDAIVEHMPWYETEDSKYRPDSKDSLLFRVVYLGVQSLLKSLLTKQTAAINDLTRKRWTALHLAISKEHIEIIEILISYGAKVNIRGSQGQYALYTAVEVGSETSLNLLIAKGTKRHRNSYHDSLVLAISMGQHKLARILLENKGNIKGYRYRYGYSPLCSAIKLGRYDLVKLLLNYGAEINQNSGDPDSYQKIAPIMLAIDRHEFEIVRLLIDRGARINKRFDTGRYDKLDPLTHASRSGSIQICQLLIDKGAKVDGDSNSNQSPLECAVRYLMFEVVKLLLKRGAKFPAAVVNRTSASKSKHKLVDISSVHCFGAKSADLDLVDSLAVRLVLFNSGIPFEHSTSAMTMSGQILELFRSSYNNELELNSAHIPDETSLFDRAVESRAFDLAKVLVFRERSITELSRLELDELLIVAVMAQDINLLEQALDAGASANAKDMRKGRNVLSMAVSYGRNEEDPIAEVQDDLRIGYHQIARTLLLRGANKEEADKKGRTPAEWGKLYQNPWYHKLFAEFEIVPRLAEEQMLRSVHVQDESHLEITTEYRPKRRAGWSNTIKRIF